MSAKTVPNKWQPERCTARSICQFFRLDQGFGGATLAVAAHDFERLLRALHRVLGGAVFGECGRRLEPGVQRLVLLGRVPVLSATGAYGLVRGYWKYGPLDSL